MAALRFCLAMLAASAAWPAVLRAQIVINELMYAPEDPEPEWVEIFNAGSSSVNLDGWFIADASTRVALPRRTIAAGGYLVLTKDSATLREVRGGRGAIVQLALPTLNNSGDYVALFDTAGLAADAVFYESGWGGTGGRSLERLLYTFPAMSDSSWASSPAASGATPGRKNASTPDGFDLGLDAAVFDAEASQVLLFVRNVGTLPSAPATAQIYFDADADGTADASELLASGSIAGLAPKDSLALALAWNRPLGDVPEPGIARVLMPADERTGNNALEFEAIAPTTDSGIVINEIMFDPADLGVRSAAEYIELRNITARTINLSGWRIHDATSRPQATILPGTRPLGPGAYLLLASDTTVYHVFPGLRDSGNVITFGRSSFSLNADRDEVTLRNRGGVVVDHVAYAAWHRPDLGDTKGIALERISADAASNDPRNWSSSAAPSGGTPGGRNTLDVPASVAVATLEAVPSTVSPDGDGFEDFTRIVYRLPVRGGRLLAVVYDRHGRAVRTIANNEPGAAEGEIVWDGRDDERRPLTPGVYVVRLLAQDDIGGTSFVACATVVVARRL